MMKAEFRPMDESEEYYFEEGCYILELSNTADDEHASISRARVEPGCATKMHILDGIAERYVILDGAGRAEVGDLPPQNVEPGDVLAIPPGCQQRIENTGDLDLVFLTICTPRFQKEAYREVEV